MKVCRGIHVILAWGNHPNDEAAILDLFENGKGIVHQDIIAAVSNTPDANAVEKVTNIFLHSVYTQYQVNKVAKRHGMPKVTNYFEFTNLGSLWRYVAREFSKVHILREEDGEPIIDYSLMEGKQCTQ